MTRKRPRPAKTSTIALAMRTLAADVVSDDGVANGALLEAAERLEELDAQLRKARGALFELYGVCQGMDAERQDDRPTEDEYQAAMRGARRALQRRAARTTRSGGTQP